MRRKKKVRRRRTDREIGAALLAKKDRSGECVIDGTKPRPGMWIVHPERKRFYGQVVRIRRKTGEVLWNAPRSGIQVATPGNLLYEGGYKYVELSDRKSKTVWETLAGKGLSRAGY